MKKSFLLFTTLLLALSVILSACAGANEGVGDNASNDVVQLKYWVPFSGGDGEYMQQMVDAFNESHEDVQVEMLNIKWEEYYTKLRTSLVSKTAPDIAVAHASKLAELVPTGMVTDLSSLAEEAGVDWNTFSDNQLNATKLDGKHYAIPLDTHALVMYYNKDYLNEAGLLDENGQLKMDPSIDSFIDVLEELKKTLPGDIFPFVSNTSSVYPFWIWYSLYSQMDDSGTYIVDGKASFDNEAAKKALQVMVDIQEKGLWPENVTNGYDLFKSGKAAINFAGVWATGNYEKNENLNFAAVPFPTLFDKPAAWGDSHTLIMPVQDNKEQQVAAAKFANWLAENGAMWAKAGHIPAKKDVLESEEYQSLKYRKDYAEAQSDVNYMPNHEKLWPVNDVIIKAFSELLNGNVSVEETIEKVEKEVNDVLEK